MSNMELRSHDNTEGRVTYERRDQVNKLPSIGFALMAWKLAQLRVWGAAILDKPVPRDQVEEKTKASVEYYHILRRLEDGETP